MATFEQVAIAEAERRYPDPIYPDGWMIKRGQRNAFVNGVEWQREQDARYKAFTEAVMALVTEMAAFDCFDGPIPPGVDVPEDYERGLHNAAQVIRDAAERAGVSRG